MRKSREHHHLAVHVVSLVVAAHALYILATTLLDQLQTHRATHLTDLLVDVPLLIGVSSLYLSTLLRRRKRTAWLVTIMAYAFYLGLGVTQLLSRLDSHSLHIEQLIRTLLPLLVLGLLFVFEREFVVKSDIQGFRYAARFSIVILVVALLYGTAGFLLLDEHDFHQDISLPSAAHYTIDQFNLTTTKPIHPYTRRAHLFVDSLSFVSLAAVVYAVGSLFQPLRVRLSDQRVGREHMAELLQRYGAPSEEFFKLWPHDKQYFFDESGEAGLAFHVHRGVALILSDPAGDQKHSSRLLNSFQDLCFNNDWLPALVHVSNNSLYEKHGFTLQKLGQEAVLDLAHFKSEVAPDKYFRQIGNKFGKQGYSTELLAPPHHKAVVERLQTISNDWLKRGGRAERGFVMGYFTPAYVQQCRVLVARDAAGTIQGFVTLVPAEFDHTEATYDLLRHAQGALGNINDYLLMNLIDQLNDEGYKRLNLGLCPLSGLDETDEDRRTFLDNFLQFAYTNGDRFYSFSGLYRFKAKYQPVWHDKYVGYQGGVRGFSRTMTALTRAMRRVVKL